MPIYAYRCTQCADEFELLVRSSTQPACPRCGSDKLDKLLTAPIAPLTYKQTIARGRAAAAKEGHFSNYSKADQAKAK